MKRLRMVWLLLVGLIAVAIGLGRHILAYAFNIPQPPGQYIIGALAVTLAAIAMAPMFIFRR